jgi:hypothetical protein
VKEKMDEIIFFFLCSCVEVCVDDPGVSTVSSIGDFQWESGENLMGSGSF